jgi:hypothetical protein
MHAFEFLWERQKRKQKRRLTRNDKEVVRAILDSLLFFFDVTKNQGRKEKF